MFLPEISVKRPVLATVMSLLIILVGVISIDRLTVREYPKIDSPVVSVRTVYTGASPQVIESQVTQPLEDSISGIEGVKTLKSVSREEVSQITVEFTNDRDPDLAANDVRDRVSRARERLPDEVNEPVIAKVEADAQAIMWLRLFSDRHGALEISDYADRFVADRLKTLPGVASVIIGGGDKAEKVEVALGARLTGAVEVASGLAAGDRVVVEGHANLRPGRAVREVAAPGMAPAPG